ncbi:hypothetical protein BCON_0082g00260 [Botryotinia convoluta]|uniref:Uncharacterized protein n=1 Tax=Botryotinia convoluta TaxID=54673 RepID=A0A4Z1IH83_9HELO|nr:hypothetical protein BCON_0082g00260 [Botryotinia convoluta]
MSWKQHVYYGRDMVVCEMWCCGAVECAMERNDLCEEDGCGRLEKRRAVGMNDSAIGSDRYSTADVVQTDSKI